MNIPEFNRQSVALDLPVIMIFSESRGYFVIMNHDGERLSTANDFDSALNEWCKFLDYSEEQTARNFVKNHLEYYND